ncbi:MAG: permease [Actinobacteria bacterium]|nr:permease [Actinomycetota bacterium]
MPAFITDALITSFHMLWEILWALILGFAISAVIQGVVSHREMARLLPDNSPRSLAISTSLGVASSSCSYASVAIARSIFRKGGDFTAAIVFEFASTNLVIELGIIMLLLLGWQFTLAEFIGGPLMIIMLAILFRIFLKKNMVEKAREQANKGIPGSMEGHARMDMSVTEGPLRRRIFSSRGFTATSHYFIMDWAAIWRDIALGLVIAGALAAWVPETFWQNIFFTDSGTFAMIWGPIAGPLVAIISFVCSIGNVPLAVVLWNGGISFGGVISFIFADLIVLPILNIYRKYYGARMSLFLLATSYAAMVAAGIVVEVLFGALGLIPERRDLESELSGASLSYTTVLNIIFLIGGAILLARFIRTGGVSMLKMMNQPEQDAEKVSDLDTASVKMHGHTHAEPEDKQHGHHHN